MALCINCGKKFSPSRGDARYCSNRCRLVTFRNSVELATVVKHHLSFGTTLDGDTGVQQRLREVMNAYPDAVRKFGEPMIRAALATKPASPRCRWDLAWMWASRLDQPKPKLSRAGRTLLGDPCPRCTKRMQPAKQRPQSSGGATRSTPNQLGGGAHHDYRVASPGTRPPTRAQRHKNCVVCSALTAGATPRVSTDRHPAWFTSVEDYERWVHAGRPPKWPFV